MLAGQANQCGWSAAPVVDRPYVMSQETKQPATRQRVIAALSQIIGLPLTAARRATDMRTFQFGTLRPVERGSVGDQEAGNTECNDFWKAIAAR